ncbi:hypothetical protein [Kutzneria sp. 744]|uniref:hypothetical protein n=1 Tax=Kutzneria sp. (strain 744) TaxID=345341 RepID=UPI0003EEB8EB|nr:hypothetical protein [Kutzneria sp. 744]EWM13942.1 hypothetical protein KUTG_04246 [Kutzneria sp. 744]
MSIPQDVELPSGPDIFGVTEDGQVGHRAAAGARACEKLPPFRQRARLRVIPAPRRRSLTVLSNRGLSRRTKQGAGVVVSGLVLGAIAIVTMHGDTPPSGDNVTVPVDANQVMQVQSSTTPTTVTQLPTP